MTITPRGVRSVSERILKDGRALIVTDENFKDYDFNALPDGSIHVDTKTGIISVKLEGETSWSPATLTVTNKEKITNPTLIIARDTQFNEEVFKITKIDLENKRFTYVIVDENKPEKEWEQRQENEVLDNGNKWVFTLENGTYLQGRNHLEISIDGVLTRTVANNGIEELSEKRFILIDTLEVGQTVIARYVKWTRIGNPYPRWFLNNEEPDMPSFGDFWLDSNGSMDEGSFVYELNKTNGTIKWSQIENIPETLEGLGIKPEYAKKEHTHSILDIKDYPKELPANGGNSNTVQNRKPGIDAGDLVYLNDNGAINATILPDNYLHSSGAVLFQDVRPTKTKNNSIWICTDNSDPHIEAYSGGTWFRFK